MSSHAAESIWTFWTLDDTESRILSDIPSSLAILAASGIVASGEWTSIDSIVGVNWEVAPDDQRSRIGRPKLAAQEWIPLDSRFADAFQSWRSQATIVSAVEATALEAGLRQLHDDLDGSHQCAQSIEGEGQHHGDYWHAIMHRREPDYGNSQYWFRRVGRHPVFAPLANEASRVAEQYRDLRFAEWLSRLTAGGTWNPMTFVDCVAAAVEHEDESFRRVVEEIQYREMLLLFAQTYRDAIGAI